MKQFYTILSASIALFVATSAYSGAKPWYMADIKKMNNNDYQQNCQKISSAQKVRTISLIAYNLVTHFKNTPNQQLKEIEAELQRFGTKLLEKEQKALLVIKNRFNIPQQQWDSWMHSVENLKKVNREAMKQEWPGTAHDPALPENIKNMLYAQLKTNNINPRSLHMHLKAIDTKTAELAHASTIINYISNPLTFTYEYEPQKIQFSTKLLSQSHDDMYAVCAHEIEHLIQQHAVTELALTMYLQHYYHISDEDIKSCAEFHELNKIHEQQAEILSSIKNPEVAAAMVQHRTGGYYPKFLYEKHYYHLTTIDMLWQLHAWVQFFHHGGISKKIDNIASQLEQCIVQFNHYWKNQPINV